MSVMYRQNAPDFSLRRPFIQAPASSAYADILLHTEHSQHITDIDEYDDPLVELGLLESFCVWQ